MQRMPFPSVKPERIDPSYQIPPSYHLQQQQQQQLIQQQQLQQQQKQQQQRTAGQATNPSHPTGGQAQVPKPDAKSSGVSDKEENIELLPDFSSIKGVFGWTTIDNVNVPFILRQDKQFVSVRIVEMKLLSRYPNSYPDDLGKHAPLTSFFITVNEAKLLNEINIKHCDSDYGKKEFSTKDLIVLLTDFILFYTLVKKTFPDGNSPTQFVEANTAGWLQIRNTVSPYVKRSNGKYLPLSVVQHAAGLLTNVKINGVVPTRRECELLNDACKVAGVEFAFSETTKLIKVDDILRVTPVEVIELPSTNPLKHATYMELPTNTGEMPKSQSRPQMPPQHAQRPSQPTSQHYRFQPNPQLDVIRSQLQGRLGSPDMGLPGGGLPPQFPGMPMFDPRMAEMYRMQNFGGQNRFPNGPPNIGPPPGVTIPPNLPVNSLAQYYMALQQSAKAASAREHSTNKGVPTSQTVSSGLSSITDFPSRSPGASNPSPRSRHPSQSHSGSRPPSNSAPLSPAVHRSGGMGSPTFPPTPEMSPGLQPSPFLGVSSQHINPHHAQHGQQPSTNDSGRMNKHTVHGHSQPVGSNIGSNIYPSPADLVSQMLGHKSSQSANQELPGLFSPTSSNVSVTQKSKPTTQTSQAVGPPPPLLMVSRPTILQTKAVSQPDSNTSQPPLLSPVGNPVPKQVVPVGVPEVSSPVVPVTSPVPVDQNPSKPPVPQPISQSVYAEAIKGSWLNNKIISCLHLDKPDRNGRFCLVEAVCKLYFHGCSVTEFLFALEKVLLVPLVTCDDSEEKAFIQYYSLPVDVLKCNKMIKFDDLDKFFPQLSYMFPDKNAGDAPAPQDSSETDSGFGDQENNAEKGVINGMVVSAQDLEAAMPGTVSEMTLKRTGDDSIMEPAAKRARVAEGNEFDDAVIILD